MKVLTTQSQHCVVEGGEDRVLPEVVFYVGPRSFATKLFLVEERVDRVDVLEICCNNSAQRFGRQYLVAAYLARRIPLFEAALSLAFVGCGT